MAFGNLIDIGWVDAFTVNKYQVQNWIKYSIDNENRKLRVCVTRQRCRGVSSIYGYNARVNNGYQLLGGTKGEHSKIYDTWETLDAWAGNWGYCPPTKDNWVDCVYSYNADGSVPQIRLATQMIFELSTGSTYQGRSVTQYWGWPQQDWKEQDLRGLFPAISAELSPISNPAISNIKVDGATLTFVGSNNAHHYKLELTSGSEKIETITLGNAYSFSNLTAGATYTCKITAVAQNGETSDSVSIQFTTDKQAHVYYNVDGTKKKGYVWVNVGGNKKKALAIWVNVNGTAKKAV